MQPNFGVKTARLDIRHNPKTYHIASWSTMDDRQKLIVITKLINQYGRHPAVTKTAMGILKRAGVKPREYTKQAAVFLKWVQKNIYYVNEPSERLQSPSYTLEHGYGDCDDLAILLCAFFHAVRLPWKLVISGRAPNGRMIRFHHGDKVLRNAQWAHIYCMVGVPPYKATKWFYCEPTLNVPLGWDVVKNGPNALPELQQNYGFPGVTLSGNQGTGVAAEEISEELAAAVAESTQKKFRHYLRDILIAVMVGSITAVSTQIVLDAVRETDWYYRRVKRTPPPKRS